MPTESQEASGHDFSRAEMPLKNTRALAPEGNLPVELALSIARQIAEGLGAAHAKGMVHRDIKPENILMARDNGAWLPKIADFGIVATKESSTAYTRTGGTLLTMAYAAPEQWRGTAAAELDGRTDLYALGGLLYEMLTGHTPFRAENYEGWARQHQTTPPPPPSALRPDLANWQGLDALILRLLAKDRNDRPKHVAELVGLIDAVRWITPKPRRETVKEEASNEGNQKNIEVDSRPSFPTEAESTLSDQENVRWLIFIPFVVLIVLILVAILSKESTQPSEPQDSAAQTQPIVQPQPEQSTKLNISSPKPSTPQIPKPDQQSIVLVQCDLACNWKLDGETKGRIEAGGSANVKVELGQHVVSAVTEDGLDKTEQFIVIKIGGQTIVHLALQPVRDARIKAEQEASNRVAHEQQERAARELAEAPWTDPATGLMWAKENNNSWGQTWQQASDYCRSLQLAGHTDWRLPTIDELQRIYDPNVNANGAHVKGNLQLTLSYSEWSSTQGDTSGEALIFDFRNGWRTSYQLEIRYANHTLCVRRS
jgi:serine/threonine protein kinase